MYSLFTAMKGSQLYKVCLCFSVLYHMVVKFIGIKFSRILLSFLSMIIYEVLGVVLNV